jgi:tRNA(His) 5'-end guanylyltransferase
MKSTDILSLGEYEKKYRKYEAHGAGFVLPSMYAVIRIDAHRYGKTDWSSFPHHEYPLSAPIWQGLIAAATELMCSEQSYSYAFVHGDEISVLLDTGEREQERRRDRIISAASSVASTAFYEEHGRRVVFHARLSELPTLEHAVHYFLWQRKVAQRNFLSRHVTVLAEKNVITASEQQRLLALPQDDLFVELGGRGLDLLSLPEALRYGSALWWSADCLQQCDALVGDDEQYGHWLSDTLLLRGDRRDDRIHGVQIRKNEASVLFGKSLSGNSEGSKATSAPVHKLGGQRYRGNTKIF